VHSSTTFTFIQLNDPVMGGKSTGNWTATDGFGEMQGEVVNVPSLSAPGFIKAAADGHFNDASSAADGALVLTVRSKRPGYKGYRLSFASGAGSPPYACAGGGSLPLSRGCFKSKFALPPNATAGFVDVAIPLADFSDLWSPATGDITSTCAEDPSACVTAKVLSKIRRLEIWAEGVAGTIDIEIRAITAVPPAAHAGFVGARASPSRFSSRPPPAFDTCSAAIQDDLAFGISGRTQPTVPVPVDADETLADAVCCDSRVVFYAEPQFLYSAPDIALFDKLSGVTTFYDSVCGLPLFKAPVGRSMADFKADTEEHGWPSFRSEEVIKENVITNETTTFVTSKCGTHLGSYLPDDQGPRWCMDLSCIAGKP